MEEAGVAAACVEGDACGEADYTGAEDEDIAIDG